MSYELKAGIGLLCFGFFFTFLGVLLFFDRGLLALGNIFFLFGVALLIGWQSLWQLFAKKINYKGSIPFLLGLFLIFVGWPVIGIIFEIYGSVVLFRGYWSSAKVFLCQIPVFGWLLQYPFLFFDHLKRIFG